MAILKRERSIAHRSKDLKYVRVTTNLVPIVYNNKKLIPIIF